MARRVQSRVLDFSGGLRSGLSEYGRRPKHFTRAENVEFRPYGACSCRKGTQRICSATMAEPPYTLMEWVNAAGAAQKYVHVHKAVHDVVRRMSGTAFTNQTWPFALIPSGNLVWSQLNGSIWATQQGAATELAVYGPLSAAETWLTGNLPAPGNTLTLTLGAGGSMTSGVAQHYWYRLRWYYADGSSKASTPQDSGAMGANTKVVITTIPITPAGRTDYLGWILERTDALGGATGPFYFNAIGTANNYTDTLADTDLDYAADENLHGTLPNGHCEGVLAMNDRLLCWQGSTVYLSQAIADAEWTGIANWNALNGYDFGRDDGDHITTVLKQADRFIVLKQNSVWALEGNDLSNYRVVHLFTGAGAAGPRAADCMGATGWFYGAAGLHRISNNSISPFGYVEVGDLIAKFFSSRAPQVVIKSHLGQRVLIAYSTAAGQNDSMLVYDQRFGTWASWTGIYAEDILVQKIVDFGDHDSFLYADVTDRDPGAGTDYRPMVGLYGSGDGKSTVGAGATSIPVLLRTPWIDDGSPDTFKDWERIEQYWQGSGLSVNVSIEFDPPNNAGTANAALNMPASGAIWGGFNWGDGTLWGSAAADSSGFSGLAVGSIGRRYRATFTANVPIDAVFKGYVLDGIVQPERRLS